MKYISPYIVSDIKITFADNKTYTLDTSHMKHNIINCNINEYDITLSWIPVEVYKKFLNEVQVKKVAIIDYLASYKIDDNGNCTKINKNDTYIHSLDYPEIILSKEQDSNGDGDRKWNIKIRKKI